MAKHRVPVPQEVAAEVLFACDYTCCVCRERGRPVQLHHIDEDPSNNDEANLAPLCLLCHDGTQVKGGFGRKLEAKLVTEYRDDWLTRVASRRDKADELAALRMAGVGEKVPTTEEEAEALMVPADEALVAYVDNLPAILAKGYAIARPRWDSGVTTEMLQGTYDLIDVVVQMLIHLASWFPDEHFDGRPAAEYFSSFVSSRFVWHRALAEPGGVGTGGTIVGPTAAAAVLDDAERAVDEMVTALLWGREGFGLKAWRRRWEQAK
jgi:hypothetical protein